MILVDITEVRTAKVSLLDLQRAQFETLTSIRSLGIPIDTEISVSENHVKVKVADRIQFDNALRNGKLRLPDNVDVITVGALAKPVTDIFGGLSLSDSTSGFAVITPGGIRGITAAAHAANNQNWSGYNLPFQQERLETFYDVQWHTAPGCTVTNKIKWWIDGSTRTIIGTVNRSAQPVGQYVAKYGRTTYYTGGGITAKNVTLGYIPNCQPTFIRVDDNAGFSPLAAGGDSGGPWFLGNDAWGVTCAVDGDGNAYYMAVDYVNGIGVSIMTAP